MKLSNRLDLRMKIEVENNLKYEMVTKHLTTLKFTRARKYFVINKNCE